MKKMPETFKEALSEVAAAGVFDDEPEVPTADRSELIEWLRDNLRIDVQCRNDYDYDYYGGKDQIVTVTLSVADETVSSAECTISIS